MTKPRLPFTFVTLLFIAALAVACTAQSSSGVPSIAGDQPVAATIETESPRETKAETTSATISSASALPLQPPATATQRQQKVVTLDPGHGGSEIGAVSVIGGDTLAEKNSNLDMAFRLRALLEESGYRVVLTREADVRATGEATGPTTFPTTRFDLQRRIDIANEAKSDIFISIHSNGSGTASESGIEVWYDPNFPWGGENLRLAQLLQRRTVDSLAAYGYQAVDRGVKDDSRWRMFRGRWIPIYVIGPPRTDTREEIVSRGAKPEDLGFGPGDEQKTTSATQMPAALVENLFLTHTRDATVLRDPGARDAIARGMRDAINEYFGKAD